MAGRRLDRILSILALPTDDHQAPHLCRVASEVVEVTGAGVMLISGDLPRGSLCSTDDISRLTEDLQYTLGEGPSVDAYRLERVISEPDLADPEVPRWMAFSPRAVEAGVRAVFGFPLRSGAARLGALNLYQDAPGGLSSDQHADALVMADVLARWVLDVQAGAPPGALAPELEENGEFYFIVHNAAGVLSVQLTISVTEALIRLRAYAFSQGRSVSDVAEDVVARKLRIR